MSLRSTDGSVDVSVIARKMGGGGHQRAAGFSTDLTYDELVEFLIAETRAGRLTLPTRASGFILADKPAGVTSHDVVARVRREHGVRVGHAGTLDPFATGLLIVLLGPATRLQRYVLGLPKTYVATARLGWRSSTGDPDGELEHTGQRPAACSSCRPAGSRRSRR